MNFGQTQIFLHSIKLYVTVIYRIHILFFFTNCTLWFWYLSIKISTHLFYSFLKSSKSKFVHRTIIGKLVSENCKYLTVISVVFIYAHVYFICLSVLYQWNSVPLSFSSCMSTWPKTNLTLFENQQGWIFVCLEPVYSGVIFHYYY